MSKKKAAGKLTQQKRPRPKYLGVKVVDGQDVKSGSILDYLQCFKVSNHEFRVIKFIEEGKSNKEIGSLMFISESTVKKHISNIFKKLNIKNRYELINFYKQIGENGVANTPKDV